ncbi:class D sortase [Cytobacillus sp. Hz8]|uniref:class D sortase n=1 Tax=Cytobacillus sp. Hz8 TaxID=3347168 RepID=UPI0035E10874
MKKRKIWIVVIAISLIAGLGFWFTTTNAYKLAKGYYLYKTNKVIVSHKKVETDKLYPTRPKIGDEIGQLEIPKLKSTLPIYHGSDEDELEKGVGHYAKSVLPGENDNTVLSGHRDTVFRRLGEIKIGDQLIIQTSAGKFTYKVKKTKIVDKNDRTIIVPKPRATLTVSTCYPFNYIGSAPKRYILIANLIKSET